MIGFVAGAALAGAVGAVWVAGFLGQQHTMWQLGSVQWLRAGKVGMLTIGPWRFVKVGRRWKRVAKVNDELRAVIDQPNCCNAPDLDEHGRCLNCQTEAS